MSPPTVEPLGRWHAPMTGRDPVEAHRSLDARWSCCSTCASSWPSLRRRRPRTTTWPRGRSATGSLELPRRVLRDLVAVDELHLVRLGLRHRRRPVPPADVRPDRRRAGRGRRRSGAFDELDFTVMVVGYVIMRIALVAQWLRAAREDPAGRAARRRFAVGISLIQVGWVVRLAIGWPDGRRSSRSSCSACSSSPCRSGRSGPAGRRRGIPEHIAERYGLFTIIVLGECVLAATAAIQAAFAAGGVSPAARAWRSAGCARVRPVVVVLQASGGRRRPGQIRSDLRLGLRPLLRVRVRRRPRCRPPGRADTTHEATSLSPATAASAVALPLVIYLLATAVLQRASLPHRLWIDLGIAVPLILGAGLSAMWIGVPAAILAMAFLLTVLVANNVAALRRLARSRGRQSTGIESRVKMTAMSDQENAAEEPRPVVRRVVSAIDGRSTARSKRSTGCGRRGRCDEAPVGRPAGSPRSRRSSPRSEPAADAVRGAPGGAPGDATGAGTPDDRRRRHRRVDWRFHRVDLAWTCLNQSQYNACPKN